MDIVDDRSYMEFFNTVFQVEMEKIKQRVSGYSGSENQFQQDKLRLEYFSHFLTDYQYFDNEVKKKPFLEMFKETFIFLSDWEKSYTKEIGEKSEQSLNFRERRNDFRHMSKSFVNYIISIYFMFNRDDAEIGVYHKYKSHKSEFYNLESLKILKTFLKDYSLLLIDVVKFDLQGMISNSLRELLDNTKSLDLIQALCAQEWYALSQEIQDMDFLQPSPILHIAFGKLLDRKLRHTYSQEQKQELCTDIPGTLREYFSRIIDQKKLITQSLELSQMVKAEELLSITEVIKELLTELREGDEIVEDDALVIIEENRPLEYLSQNELAEYFKQLLIELPDFEYIRLKKSFRRKSSQQTELLNNIDSVYLRSIPVSLKNIEASLLEIKQSQSDLLDQTKQIQDFLESQFDLVLNNQAKIEEYLFEKLGSDFEKIKHLWIMYMDKQITGKEFVQKATRILGLKFSKTFLGLIFFLK